MTLPDYFSDSSMYWPNDLENSMFWSNDMFGYDYYNPYNLHSPFDEEFLNLNLYGMLCPNVVRDLLMSTFTQNIINLLLIFPQRTSAH